MEDSLTMQVTLIKNSIETSYEAAIKSYYRAVAYTAQEVINACYEKFREGTLTEQESQNLAWSLMKGQSLGPSGYITVLNSLGVMVYHPFEEYVGADLSGTDLTNAILQPGEHFIEYEWLNPGDENPRDKLMYSLRYPPWDWYISVTGYENELVSLVSIQDFKEKILSIRFGETGYPLVLDQKGTLLIHPEYEGVNMYNRDDSMGELVRTVLKQRNGKLEYLWKNPGEQEYQNKVTLFSELPRFGIIVAVTAYEKEVMAPLGNLKKMFLFAILLSLLLVGLLTRQISRSITMPIIEIKQKMDAAASGDLTIRSRIVSTDEIGEIGIHFNQLIQALQNKQSELKEQLDVNSEITRQLRDSLDVLKQTQRRLIEEERFSNMGRLLARISHHLNTPIGNAVMAVSYLKEEAVRLANQFGTPIRDDSLMEKHGNNILEASALVERAMDRAVDIIKNFKLLQVDPNSRNLLKSNIKEFLQVHYLTRWKDKLPRNISLRLICNETLELKTDFMLLQLVLDNLTSNSLVHGFRYQQEGEITLEVRGTPSGVEILYADTGEGIPLEMAGRVFEPFFSLNKDFRSTGIGLNIVYNVVKISLEGSIRYSGDQGEGASYFINLPDLD